MVLDFDSTIARSTENLFHIDHQMYWNDGPTLYLHDNETWGALDAHLDPADRQRMWAYFHSTQGIMNCCQIFEGAATVINNLMRHGVFVRVLTDRMHESYDALLWWFRSNNISTDFHHFALTITDAKITKHGEVQEMIESGDYDVIAVVDDAPHHMERFSDVYGDFMVYSFRYPYNDLQIQKGLATEITSWSDLERNILEELARRQAA